MDLTHDKVPGASSLSSLVNPLLLHAGTDALKTLALTTRGYHWNKSSIRTSSPTFSLLLERGSERWNTSSVGFIPSASTLKNGLPTEGFAFCIWRNQHSWSAASFFLISEIRSSEQDGVALREKTCRAGGPGSLMQPSTEASGCPRLEFLFITCRGDAGQGRPWKSRAFLTIFSI